MIHRTASALPLLLLAALPACQSTPPFAATQPIAQHTEAAANPFVGYWTSSETFGKPISTTSASFKVDLTPDGQAVLVASPFGGASLYSDNGTQPKDEIRLLHWQPSGSFIRITDPHDPAFVLNARIEGDNTLVIASPDFYIRMTRTQ